MLCAWRAPVRSSEQDSTIFSTASMSGGASATMCPMPPLLLLLQTSLRCKRTLATFLPRQKGMSAGAAKESGRRSVAHSLRYSRISMGA